jgi:hypothetical protein
VVMIAFSTDDLMRIASCGGGFTIRGGHRSVDDLMVAECIVPSYVEAEK